MPKVNVNGCEFHVNERGAGLPLVLLHGFPMDSRIWDAQVAALSDRYRVIAPDLRGFGRSLSQQPFSIVSLADDVQAILRQMQALPCVLGGLSMGGYVALAYQQMCPTDFRGLILMHTKAEADSTEGKVNRLKTLDLLRSAGPAALIDQMLPKQLSPGTLQSKPQVVQRLREIMAGVPSRTIELAQLAMHDREDRSGYLPSIPDPVLIVVGQDDTLSPRSVGEQMQQSIPRSKLVVIPQAAHVSPLEQPEHLNDTLREFLAGLSQ